MANLYDKAGLVNIPVGYQEGFLYNIKPTDNTLGFRFNRDSAATRVNKEGLIEQVGYFGPELVQNGNFSELGPELIPDGNFTNQAAVDYWQIANTGGVERATKSLENGFMRLTYDIANGSALFKSGIVTSGKSYKVTFRAKGTANSNFNSIGDNVNIPSNPQYVVSNPTLTDDWQNYEFYVPVSSTVFRLYLASAQIGDTLDITNISVKQVDPNDYWTLGTGWSFGDGIVEANNTSSFINQSGLIEASKLYRLTFEARLKSGTNGTINAYIGGSNNQQFTIANTDWQSFTYEDTRGSSIADSIYFNNNGTELELDNVSVVEVKGDKPRIDYTDSLTSPSFLLEPQSTNLVEFSEDFTQWIKTDVTVTENQVLAPNGTLTADKLDFSASTTSRLANIINTSSGTYTFSVYLKSVSGSGNFRLALAKQGGSISTKTIYLTEEWQRFDLEHTYDGLTNLIPYVGYYIDNTYLQEVYAWGAQVEALSYATSYIPTAGSTVTRAEETCIGAGNVSTFNSTEGVLYAEIASLTTSAGNGERRIVLAKNGDTNNVVRIYYNNTANTIQYKVRVASSNVCDLTYDLGNSTGYHKICGKWKQNDFALWVDGVKVATDTSGTVFPANTLNTLNFSNASASSDYFYGKTKGVYVFNEALTDDELQQLTGPEYNSFAALAAAYNYTVI